MKTIEENSSKEKNPYWYSPLKNFFISETFAPNPMIELKSRMNAMRWIIFFKDKGPALDHSNFISTV